jgi:hypothetical protein
MSMAKTGDHYQLFLMNLILNESHEGIIETLIVLYAGGKINYLKITYIQKISEREVKN